VKRLGWISNFLLIANIFFGILLLLSLSAAYVNPVNWWWPSLAGLGFLQIFFINLLFLLFWLLFKIKNSLIALIFLIFGFTELPNQFQFNFPQSPKNREIKILSLNVRNFDLYNWSENKKTRDKILHVIKSRDSEIICLQEFFNTTNPKHDFKTLDTILGFENKYNSHVEYTATVKETEHWGIATFTTYPVVGKGAIHFEESSNNICIYSDIIIESTIYRIYNMHLASLRFGREDYQYLENVTANNLDKDVESSKSLLKKLKSAFQRRAVQVVKVRDHMKDSPYPIILCGDFNDTPTSFAYNQLAKGLHDTFKYKGNGFGTTYNGNIPYLRIDYIFTDPSINVLKHEVIRNDISDHYPISASIELKE